MITVHVVLLQYSRSTLTAHQVVMIAVKLAKVQRSSPADLQVSSWQLKCGRAQAIQPKEAASVSSAEVALCSGSELVMLGIAAAFSEPASFSLLVDLSAAAVLSAACLYSAWVFCCEPRRALQGALGTA